ncbi:MAG: ATP synthase F1 subunit gamma [Clostridia bacterium]|nr:ATP synthase F1 subunit gamma [Clostridia bacterium]
MAGRSMNDIKAHIKSVESTRQITKAMELVATSKLRRAKEKAERSRPYFEVIRSAIDIIDSSSEAKGSIWSAKSDDGPGLLIVIAGDRGLAGGYNSNIFKLAASLYNEGDIILPIGKKALEHYRHRGNPIFSDSFEYADDVSVGRALDISKLIAMGYKSGEFKRVTLVYTKFVSMLTQLPQSVNLLPLNNEESKTDLEENDILFEGDPEEMLDKIVPQYIGGVLTAAVSESLASESGARRTAMNAANKNATEMIDSLMLSYNRARQAVITQEITEIVSGSEAL